jgi:hypothetical protein
MRKQFAATVRTVSVPKTLPRIRRLSLEEEALILDQAHQDFKAVDNGMQEVGRQLEISDALEDLAVVAQNIRQASPTEIELIQSAGQMAVAGTDNEPELMLPALEGMQEGKNIAFESFAEKANVLWKNILAFLARLWEKIVAFFRVHVVVGEMRGKIQTLMSKIKSGTGTIGTIARTPAEVSEAFMFNGKNIARLDEVTKGMQATIQVAKYLYEDYVGMIKNAGDKVSQALESFKPDTADQTLTSLVSQLGGLDFARIPGAKADGTDGAYQVVTSQSFLGGGKLVAKTFKSQPGMHPSAALEAIRGSGITLERGDASYLSASELNEQSFEVPSQPAAMVACLQAGESLLMVIENFHKTHLGELKKVADRMKAASSKAAASFASSTVDESGDAMREFKSAVNLNAAYARWSQSPALPFYSQMIRACRAMVMVCGMAVNAGIHKSDEPVAAAKEKTPDSKTAFAAGVQAGVHPDDMQEWMKQTDYHKK